MTTADQLVETHRILCDWSPWEPDASSPISRRIWKARRAYAMAHARLAADYNWINLEALTVQTCELDRAEAMRDLDAFALEYGSSMVAAMPMPESYWSVRDEATEEDDL